MTWQRYIAIGDSFTEGLDDLTPMGFRGWADHLALHLAATEPAVQYANLAVRGRKLQDIVDRQLPAALEQQPDLISIAGGINDALRPTFSAQATASLLERGVRQARQSGADVLLFAFGELHYRSKMLGLADRRILEFRELTLEVGRAHDCIVVDFGPIRLFDDDRFWSVDRLHLNALGHERAGMLIAEGLGIGTYEWRQPLPPKQHRNPLTMIRDDAHWTAQHLSPWLARRLRRRSSGDNVDAKRPTLSLVTEGNASLLAPR